VVGAWIEWHPTAIWRGDKSRCVQHVSRADGQGPLLLHVLRVVVGVHLATIKWWLGIHQRQDVTHAAVGHVEDAQAGQLQHPCPTLDLQSQP
jgi:hypothetical protein